MSVRKNARDDAREAEALRLNGRLVRTNVSVSAGGRTGPYRVTATHLNARERDRVIALLLEAFGQEMGPAGPTPPAPQPLAAEERSE